jgi:hypothetical protein
LVGWLVGWLVVKSKAQKQMPTEKWCPIALRSKWQQTNNKCIQGMDGQLAGFVALARHLVCLVHVTILQTTS